MIGVSGGLASTLGLLNPSTDVLIQMGGAVIPGTLLGALIAARINVR